MKTYREFHAALVRALGKEIELYVRQLYRKQFVAEELERYGAVVTANGRALSTAEARDLIERAFESVQAVSDGRVERIEEVKRLLAEVKNRYGSEVELEVKRTVSRAVDGIYEERRRVEVNELLGGHTLAKHVGQSEKRLLERLKREPDIEGSSSFASRKLAAWAQREFIKHYEREIAERLKTNKETFDKKLELDRELGLVVDEKGREYRTNKVRVVLVRDETEVGYHVHTSYPIR